MHRHVSWVLELDVNSGREDEFRDLMAEMVVATRVNEPGTLKFEWSMCPEGRRCHLYSRYADSAAAMTHLSTFYADYSDRFFDVLTPVRLVVYGTPSDEVKDALAGFEPVYMQTAAGFRR